MKNIIICFVLVIGYVLVSCLYTKVKLRGRNNFLSYGTGVMVALHSLAQICLLYFGWKEVLVKSEKYMYFQIGILIIGVILLMINARVDSYIIEQESKKDKKYCIDVVDHMQLIAREKGATKEIQDLLRYMTPKVCKEEDERILKMLEGLTEDNMSVRYSELKRIITLREEKLKIQCRL